MKGLRYRVPPVIYYNFLVPGGDFHFGLRPLGNDEDIVNFAQYVSEHKVMKVYTEHGETRLLTYFLNPKPVQKVTFVWLDEDIPEEVQHTNEAPEEVQHIGEAPEEKADEAPLIPTLNVDVQEISTLPRCTSLLLVDVVPTPPNQTEIHGNELLQVVSLSPKYNRRKVTRKDCSKILYMDGIEGSQRDQEDISKDNDYWVDEDNVIDDVEVDMRDFNISIDTKAEFLDKRVRNPRQHESDEVPDKFDVIENDAFYYMDGDSDHERKRRAAIKRLCKEKSYYLSEVHKFHFQKGQKYNSKHDLKEKIKLHAQKTKKKYFLSKNDKFRLRTICKGVVAFSGDVVGEPTHAEKSKVKSKKNNKRGNVKKK
uniref:Uncharacterized protein n=1 Tax=Lactuca sativa TaxID=4236 RepID=A0A9R1X1V6_LACSA|nr:hypothetical protein LSAT_V11C700347660 [Lactuca sativa]